MSEIKFLNVSKSFVTGLKKRQVVLDNLSLEINKGEIFGFLGPNGAGKSTAINLALDFIRPDSGQIYLKDKLSTLAESRRHIGYLPEKPLFYEHLTPIELLKFSGNTYNIGKKKLIKDIKNILTKVELVHVINNPIRTFSKGMKQRIGLAMAILHDPQVLILDEPMSGLDPMGRKLVTNIILELKKNGKTIFFSSHILNDVEVLCDKIAVLHKGKLLYEGIISNFNTESKTLEQTFVDRIIQAENGEQAVL